jgi:NADH-quinone oxidoreductase subunit C
MNIDQNVQDIQDNLDIKLDWLNKIDKNFYEEILYHKNGVPVLVVKLERLVELLKFLRDSDELRFKILADIVGIDYVMHPKYKKRFSALYNLLSIKYNLRVFLQIFLDDDEELDSVHEIFSSATWLEREVFDMFGLRFKNALDHRRILTDYGFEHFPLRKDYPLTGYDEVRYDFEKKEVVYSPVELDQDFRDFHFETQWEGADYVMEKMKDSK